MAGQHLQQVTAHGQTGMQIPTRRSIVLTRVSLVLVLAGCDASASSVSKTLDDPQYTDHPYSDFLVNGVASD